MPLLGPRSLAWLLVLQSDWRCGLARDESVLPLLNGGAIGILIFSTPPTIPSILAASALLLYEVSANHMKVSYGGMGTL